MQNGKIGVTTENIFPIIKKFLYSDHEIFLRELVSNAVDATQKIKKLAAVGEFDGELGDLTIKISLDADTKTLTISDRGVGMNAQEVEKYINQIAFSGAEEFMEKYKDQSIIGHFGLGFYSSFMVSDKVELHTQSFREEDATMDWSCDGTPEYALGESADKRTRGTDIVLHISDDNAEFASESKISELLNKYCRFLPVPIAFGKKKEWKDGQNVETEEDNIINNSAPLWTKKANDITSEQYAEFYSELYPTSDEPLFNIHLSIDYPFNLTGILYFPKIKNNIEIQKNKIQLYSNQVYVTDSVEGIVPEFLTLLHGVIDSPDIPLNVSRSYLQSDSNVKKISSYITRKVGDRLQELFVTSREEFEQKWDDLKVFIEYGIVTEEKFAEKAMGFTLLKSQEGKYFTQDEYKTLVKDNQTDKHGTIIYLYSNDLISQDSFTKAAMTKGYDVLVMDGQLDNHFINWFESKNQDVRFVRVDSDVVDKLIQKDEALSISLSSDQQEILRPVFEAQLSSDKDVHFNVSFEPMSESDAPVMIVQNEYMRRMKEMSAMGGGSMAQFYGQMPDNFTAVVNGNSPLVIDVLESSQKSYGDDLSVINQKIESAEYAKQAADAAISGKKDEEISTEAKDAAKDAESKLQAVKQERADKLKAIGAENKLVKQIVDLALLSNGMLKGEKLTEFVQRSVELLKK
ncbi:MAG: molecular chaperone HtpG [Rikenellaceae bacterium]